MTNQEKIKCTCFLCPTFSNSFQLMAHLSRCTGFLSHTTQSIVRRSFQWLGRSIHAHPLWFILLGTLLIFICLAGGLIYISFVCHDDETKCMDNRTSYLWVPRRSTVWSQYTEIVDNFGTYPSVLVLLLTVNDGESILNPQRIDSAFDIIKTIDNITLPDHNDRDYEYSDLCTRSVRTQSHCDSAVDNFFAVFFENDESLWNDMNTTLRVINTPGAPTTLYLGGLQYEEGDAREIISARSLRLVYALKGSSSKRVEAFCVYLFSFRFVSFSIGFKPNDIAIRKRCIGHMHRFKTQCTNMPEHGTNIGSNTEMITIPILKSPFPLRSFWTMRWLEW